MYIHSYGYVDKKYICNFHAGALIMVQWCNYVINTAADTIWCLWLITTYLKNRPIDSLKQYHGMFYY